MSAVIKLMPALQDIFGAIAQLRYCGHAVDVLHADMQSLSHKARKAVDYVDSVEGVEPLPFQHRFELQSVTFSYPAASQRA